MINAKTRVKNKMITVSSWINWDDAEKLKPSIDMMGGFVDGHGWDDYKKGIGADKDDDIPHLTALKKSIIENNIKFTGSDHQNLPNGVPLFSDGTVALFTFRGWGDLLAAIWNTEEKTDMYSYMSFYC